jgi:hypothetical protein
VVVRRSEKEHGFDWFLLRALDPDGASLGEWRVSENIYYVSGHGGRRTRPTSIHPLADGVAIAWRNWTTYTGAHCLKYPSEIATWLSTEATATWSLAAEAARAGGAVPCVFNDFPHSCPLAPSAEDFVALPGGDLLVVGRMDYACPPAAWIARLRPGVCP